MSQTENDECPVATVEASILSDFSLLLNKREQLRAKKKVLSEITTCVNDSSEKVADEVAAKKESIAKEREVTSVAAGKLSRAQNNNRLLNNMIQQLEDQLEDASATKDEKIAQIAESYPDLIQNDIEALKKSGQVQLISRSLKVRLADKGMINSDSTSPK